jgi:hypothetical protein
VMDNFEVGAKLRILILESVEAVRTTGHDLLDLVVLQDLDILLAESLIEVFITHAASGIATAAFLHSEYAEVDPGGLQDLGGGDGHLHVPVFERSGAATQ